ncbi:histone-lysine N-methyltransferase SETMAR [Trichonephila clavipes]|nr:histone-lysine N-methyltransferase SETMAR [Trichonephila clavipes]
MRKVYCGCRGVECRGAHTALVVRQFLAANGVVKLDHPPYSPDLAHADFFPLPRLKSALKGKRFTDITDIQSNLTAEQKAIPKELFYRSFQGLYTRFQQCINIHGDYFEGHCQVIYSQFGLAIHPNDHQARRRRRFVEWAQNEIAVVPDFHKRILFSDEAHFWLNGYVNKQNGRIWSEANPQVYVETPLHPEKLTVWCALWAGGILLQKR